MESRDGLTLGLPNESGACLLLLLLDGFFGGGCFYGLLYFRCFWVCLVSYKRFLDLKGLQKHLCTVCSKDLKRSKELFGCLGKCSTCYICMCCKSHLIKKPCL